MGSRGILRDRIIYSSSMNEESSVTPVSSRISWLNIPLAVLIAGVMVSSSIIYVGNEKSASVLNNAQQDVAAQASTPPTVDPATLVEANDPMLGNPKAKVTIVEFSDFQCPFCRAFYEDTYAQLKKEYIDTGKARLVFRDYPLPFHDAAEPSALAADCANEQGKFWQFHDTVFDEQAKKGSGTITYGVTELKQWARISGLDGAKFDQCLDSAKYDAEVTADAAAGSAAGVSGTPSFFINGKLLIGAQPFSSFKAAIDAEL